jgi:hypothetical protein
MVRRYTPLAADHLIGYAENIAEAGPKLAQSNNVAKLAVVK